MNQSKESKAALEKIKKTKCILLMDDEHKEKFLDICSRFIEKLNREIRSSTQFNLHDFNYHCTNIYEIISDIFMKDWTALPIKDFDSFDLFKLNIAVLFHDYALVLPDPNKKTHADDGRTKFLELSGKENGISALEIKMSVMEEIGEIIGAHSDGETKKYKKVNDIHNSKLREMAAVLRLADGLDMTVNRRGPVERYEEIANRMSDLEKKRSATPLRKDEEKSLDDLKESLKHWGMLSLFSNIEYKDEKVMFTLFFEGWRDLEANSPDNHQTSIKQCTAIHKKLIEEFEFINDIKEWEYFYRPKLFEFLYDDRFPHNIFEPNRYTNLEWMRKEYEEEYEEGAVLKEIKDEIDPNPKPIHYQLYDGFCAHDWINVEEVLENKGKVEKICKGFVKEIRRYVKVNNIKMADVRILGIDSAGSIMSPRIALDLGVPFAYALSRETVHYKKAKADKKTKDVEKPLKRELLDAENLRENLKGKKIFIIKGMVVTYKSIVEKIEKNEINKDDIVRIYSIFYRKPVFHCCNLSRDVADRIRKEHDKIRHNEKLLKEKVGNRYISKHKFITDEFNINIYPSCNRDGCDNCFATNPDS